MVNNAMNIGLHVFFQMLFLFSMNMYLGAELLDHIVVLFLVFWGTFILFSIVAVTIYIPTNSAWEFLFFFFFPYPHQRLLFVVSLIIAILTGMRWYFLVIFECIFLMISIVENLFICLLAICMSLWENICVGLLPIFWLGFLLFRYCIVWDAYIFWILTPIGHIISKYFLPFSRLSFYLLLVSFALQKFLSLIRSHLFILLLFPLLRRHIQKILLRFMT